MSLDFSKIKPGDEVTIKAEVVAAHEGGSVKVVTPHGVASCWVDRSDIVSHTPKALCVGDRVRKLVHDLDDDGRQRIYTITAMDDDGWLLLADRGPNSRVASSLSFVERAT